MVRTPILSALMILLLLLLLLLPLLFLPDEVMSMILIWLPTAQARTEAVRGWKRIGLGAKPDFDCV